jgi:energy-coupling factor transporter ATP-binding protein EcfA2
MIKIIKADERIAANTKINIALFGPSGVGKTTQARTLRSRIHPVHRPGSRHAGDPGLERRCHRHPQDRPGHERSSVGDCARLGVPGLPAQYPADADGPYSRTAYDAYVKALDADPAMLDKYKTVFVDSITVASRLAFAWAQKQPEAFSEKTGKPDTRGAYGTLGREMIRWLTNLQHCPKDIVLVGILDSEQDDLKRWVHTPQVEGSKTGRELPGIFDQVVHADQHDDRGRQAVPCLCLPAAEPMGIPRQGSLRPPGNGRAA